MPILVPNYCNLFAAFSAIQLHVAMCAQSTRCARNEPDRCNLKDQTDTLRIQYKYLKYFIQHRNLLTLKTKPSVTKSYKRSPESASISASTGKKLQRHNSKSRQYALNHAAFQLSRKRFYGI